MIIQALIITLLTGTLGLILIQTQIGRFLRSLMALAILTGMFLTVSPDTATKAANLVGVGRGTDLLFYLWILLSSFALFALYVSIDHKTRQITELTRALATLELEIKLSGQ
jgi:small membrane protein